MASTCRHASWPWKGGEVRAHMTDLARELGKLGAWVRLHYVYPYPHVDRVMPLMAEGLVLPYLDIPFQHASPKVLKAMKRPANEAKVLERIRGWREICPDIAIRSTFIVGFPGETEEDFDYLLEWLDEAQLDRVGAFRFEPVSGAAANALPGAVPEEVKEERYARFMEKTAAISAAKLRGQGRPHDRRDHRRGRRGRRRHRPLEGRRARDRRRGPSARRRASGAGRHRPGARRGCRRARSVRRAAGAKRRLRCGGAGSQPTTAPIRAAASTRRRQIQRRGRLQHCTPADRRVSVLAMTSVRHDHRLEQDRGARHVADRAWQGLAIRHRGSAAERRGPAANPATSVPKPAQHRLHDAMFRNNLRLK